jgi:hypothetical protein
MVKEAEVKLPVESEPKAEPELSIPEVPAAGSDKSVSEMVPPSSANSSPLHLLARCVVTFWRIE